MYRAGGKRFRPYLAMLSYQALGGVNTQGVLPACAALETLHIAMLMHDDIIDRDYVRHGQPNIAELYRRYYRGLSVRAADHQAAGATMLAGDMLITESYALITESDIPSKTKIEMMRLLSRTMRQLAGGELLDSEAPLHSVEYSDSLLVAELKTASYSSVLPLLSGGVLAGAPDAVCRQLEEIGRLLGVAFQLADDLLGVFGTEAQTGKSVLSDVREGKRSYVVQQAYKHANGAQQSVLNQAIGNPDCNEAMLAAVQVVLVECGARAATERLMMDYTQKIISMIADLPVSAGYAESLRSFCKQAIWRHM